jgi:hypothetical protein
MTRRQLLGGAAILAVVLTALWYVVGPQRGNGEAPGASVQVAVSATAVGTGSWVRYLITVKNLADGDFVGDVRLVDEEQGTDAVPGSGSLGTLTRPQIPTAPASAGQSAYQVHLAVPSRTSRTVAVLAPDFLTVVEAAMGGATLDREAVEHPAVIPVAVLSDVETAATTILGLRFDTFTPRVAEFGAAAGFPANALLLAGYSTIVVDRFDTATLSAAQVGALRDFVGFGGTLVVAGGADWRRTLAPLPADLLPVRPMTTAEVPLAPLAGLTGASVAPRAAAAATGSLAQGARRLLDGAGGVPLVAELSYGAGRVVELAYDPSDDANAQTPYSTLGWAQAIGRSLDEVPGSAPMASSMLGPDPSFTALLPAGDGAPLPPLWLMLLVVLAYVAIAGPLGYLLVSRRWGRPGLFWATVPVSAVAFTAAFYFVGSALQGSLQDHEIQVVRVGPGQSVNVLEYHRVLFLRRGEHEIVPARNTLVAPLTLQTFRTTGSTCERCSSELGGLPSGSERVAPGLRPVVAESGVVYGSVRVVAASGIARAPVGLDAQLSIKGGRVQGTVTNTGRQTVFLPELFSSDGQMTHGAALAAGVAPGARISVDVPLTAADSPGPGLTWEQLLLRSVAAQALTARGQVVLVGLTEPLPSQLTVDGQSPPGAALAVLEQPISVNGADSAIRDSEDKWLAGSSGDARTGITATYDLLVPRTDVPLALDYNPQWASSVDVYDWTRGVFVTAAGQAGADPAHSTVALSPDQVRDGLVRVREHEPRLSWATNLWVDAARTG